MKKELSTPIIIIIIIGLLGLVIWLISSFDKPSQVVTNFDSCVQAGNAVMESYPRQCSHQGKTYTESRGLMDPSPSLD